MIIHQTSQTYYIETLHEIQFTIVQRHNIPSYYVLYIPTVKQMTASLPCTALQN